MLHNLNKFLRTAASILLRVFLSFILENDPHARTEREAARVVL